MEILTYPIGLLIGLFPVSAELGPSGRPAELRLNGRAVCALTASAPTCLVDLGPDPRPQRLELVRTDRAGGVVERVERGINRPGSEAEIRATGSCDGDRRDCSLTLDWAHPERLDPKEVRVSLDGIAVSPSWRLDRVVRVRFPRAASPQVLTVEADFPDGRRASITRLLRGNIIETARASLLSLPVELPPGAREADVAGALKAAGLSARAVEKGPAEVAFVVEPGAFGHLGNFSPDLTSNPIGFRGPLADIEAVRLIIPNEELSAFALYPSARAKDLWFGRLLQFSSAGSAKRIRIADAVAAAGLGLGGSPRRRAVVLVLSDRAPDESTFTPVQAAAYLRSVHVPLSVWRVKDAAAPGWPAGRRLDTPRDMPGALALLRHDLERQRVVWIEGEADLEDGTLEKLPIAGRRNDAPRVVAAEPPSASAPRATPSEPAGLLLGSAVYAVVARPGPGGSVLAATSRGLLESTDGKTWKRVASLTAPPPVFAAAVGAAGFAELLVGSSGALHRSLEGGTSWAHYPSLAVFCVAAAPSDPRVVYAGGRAELWRSDDGGLAWRNASGGLVPTAVLDVAVHPRKPRTAWAATAGGGVWATRDGGQSWKATGVELKRTVVRSLLIGSTSSEFLHAGTDAGVFRSENGGRRWRRASRGLPRGIVYGLARDPRAPSRLWAATAAGLYASPDDGETWTSAASGLEGETLKSVAVAPGGERLIVGTLASGIFSVPLE